MPIIIFCYSCCLLKAGATLSFSSHWHNFPCQLKISPLDNVYFFLIVYWIFRWYLNRYCSTLLIRCYYLVSLSCAWLNCVADKICISIIVQHEIWSHFLHTYFEIFEGSIVTNIIHCFDFKMHGELITFVKCYEMRH